MKAIAYRVGLAAVVAFVILTIDATVEELLLPRVSVFTDHVISMGLVAALTFIALCYVVPHRDPTLEPRRQPDMSENATRLLLPLLATMRKGMLIVNSRLDIILYNDAVTGILRLPVKESQSGGGAGRADDSAYGLLVTLAPTPEQAERNVGQQPRLIDATRDPAINDAFRQVLEQRTAVEVRVELIGRVQRIYHLRVTPLDVDLAAGVFFDITELERLERVRREFFANLSHELRTPLTAILAYADTLEAGGFDDPQNSKRFIGKLHKHATRMSKLITDISDLSAIESGNIHLALEPLRLHGIIGEVIALAEARRQDYPVSFCVSVPENLVVQADRTRLEQILSNLIDNAVKFNRPGGLVTVNAESAGDKAVILIEDTGVGITALDLPRIFERLYRADKSRSNRIEGTGLGLAIVKHLVQAHCGEITATTELGRGSRFTFTVPLAAPADMPDESIHSELSVVDV